MISTYGKKCGLTRDHGKSYDTVYHKTHGPGFRWLHESFGTNWRLTEMQSALGRLQLQLMPEWTAKRQQYSAQINAACQHYPVIRTSQPSADIEHACYKHYVFVRPEALASGWSRDEIITAITREGVPCMQGSCSEVYLEKAFDNTDFRPQQRLPTAKALGEQSLMFLVHPSLSESAIDYATEVIDSVLQQAST